MNDCLVLGYNYFSEMKRLRISKFVGNRLSKLDHNFVQFENAREHRYWIAEIAQARQKLTFDGSNSLSIEYFNS